MSTALEIVKPDDGHHPVDNLMPVRVGDKIKMAKVMFDSGLMPKGYRNPQQVFIALQMAHELGVTKPIMAVNNIAVIDNKPFLSSAMQAGVARSHPDFVDLKIEDDGDQAVVTVYRKVNDGTVREYEGKFSMADAEIAGLLGKRNWITYPEDMRIARAQSKAVRRAFNDILAGAHTEDEAGPHDDGPVLPDAPAAARNVTPEPAKVEKTVTPEIEAAEEEAAETVVIGRKDGKTKMAESIGNIQKMVEEDGTDEKADQVAEYAKSHGVQATTEEDDPPLTQAENDTFLEAARSEAKKLQDDVPGDVGIF